MTYSAFDYLAMFGAGFLIVFLLALQSKNTQHSRYVLAAITNLGIGAANFLIIKYIVAGDWTVLVTSCSGGSFGSMAGIWVYDKMLHKKPCLILKP